MQEEVTEAEFEEIVEETPVVNVGTPGHIDHDDVPQDSDPQDETVPKAKMSKMEVVKALAAAVENDQLDRKSAARIRSEMGIFQSSFTKKRESEATRKTKRKLQKKARKKQRK